ncbi:hypothetical protein [Kitasatospora aureofaciens]|uniref:hypothetical protein n=1 Tax=Kitasatospora aureofaciens TaxID=1894 RepID=UPI0036F454E7
MASATSTRTFCLAAGAAAWSPGVAANGAMVTGRFCAWAGSPAGAGGGVPSGCAWAVLAPVVGAAPSTTSAVPCGCGFEAVAAGGCQVGGTGCSGFGAATGAESFPATEGVVGRAVFGGDHLRE